MNQSLEKLDKSMKQLTLDLMNYREDDPKYQQTLRALAKQYQLCKSLLALAENDINNTFYFKYSDIGDIEVLLTNAGYIEQSKRPASR